MAIWVVTSPGLSQKIRNRQGSCKAFLVFILVGEIGTKNDVFSFGGKKREDVKNNLKGFKGKGDV